MEPRQRDLELTGFKGVPCENTEKMEIWGDQVFSDETDFTHTVFS